MTASGKYVGDTMPVGVISFNSNVQTFDAVQIIIPPQPLAASNFVVDNIIVTAVATTQPVSVAAVTNGASYAVTSVAPGEIVTLFGAGLGQVSLAYFAFDSNNRVPTTLAGARVLYNGFPAPLIYTSDKQSAAIVPFEVTGQPTAEVRVEYNGTVSATVPVTNTMPGIFAADSSGRGPGPARSGATSDRGALPDQLCSAAGRGLRASAGRAHLRRPAERANPDRSHSIDQGREVGRVEG